MTLPAPTPLTAQLADVMRLGPNGLFGLQLDHADADHVEISWMTDDRHLQPQGIVHGGVYCTVVEIAASIGAGLWYRDRGHVVGLANHTDFLRPANDGVSLTASATPVKRGRSQQLWQVQISDTNNNLIAQGFLRLQNIPQA